MPIADIISLKLKNPPSFPVFYRPPGSKSMTNRALLLAAMSAQPVELTGVLSADDSHWGFRFLETLAFTINRGERPDQVFILPPLSAPHTGAQNTLSMFLGQAGTLARFCPAPLLNWTNTFPHFPPLKVQLSAHEQLTRRPLKPLLGALRQLGANIEGDVLPITIESSSLAGECAIEGHQSGQFLSGLLLAAAGAKNPIRITRTNALVQPDYVRMTIKMCSDFGAHIDVQGDLEFFSITPAQKGLGAAHYTIEPDASTACYFVCLAILHGIELRIFDLGSQTVQPDYQIVSLLRHIGAHIEIQRDNTTVLKGPQPHKLRGNCAWDGRLWSDQAMTLGVMALFSEGPIEIRGIGHIRHHESDRIGLFVKNLCALGFQAHEEDDGFVVFPTSKKSHEVVGDWPTYEDHRFAMVGALLASRFEGIRILNAGCVAKTAPDFFRDMEMLGFSIGPLEE